MPNLKVAALMLCHPDRAKFQDRAFDCVMAQTVFAELICVNTNPIGTIGVRRNVGVQMAIDCGCNVIAHFDDDDYSFPDRIKSQLRDLEESDVGAVGYRAMRFWDSTKQQAWWYRNMNPRYALGTSLMYHVDVWKKHPFPDLQVGEDAAWCAIVRPNGTIDLENMVAEIHGGNTSGHIDEKADEWFRMSQQDEGLKEIMAL